MRKAIQDYPTMTFRYEESGDGFMVTVEYSQQKQSTKETEQVAEGVKNLLDFIKVNPGLRPTQIEVNLNVPVKTLERWLKQLKEISENTMEFRKNLSHYSSRNVSLDLTMEALNNSC